MTPMALEGTAFSIDTVTSAVSTALGDFSASNVVAVIGAGLAIAVPLVLTWFAFRFIYKKAKGGLKGGK